MKVFIACVCLCVKNMTQNRKRKRSQHMGKIKKRKEKFLAQLNSCSLVYIGVVLTVSHLSCTP